MDAAAPLYAGFWRRFAALLLDALVFLIPWFFAYDAVVRGEHSWLWLHGATFVAAWTYNAGLHASPLQATLGKMMLSLKVTGLRGERLHFGRASLRYLAGWLSLLPLMLGFLLIPVSRIRQALHDRLAGTVVVRRDASAVEVAQGGGVMGPTVGVVAGAVGAFVLLWVALITASSMSVYHSMAVRSKVAEAMSGAMAAKLEVEEWIRGGRLPPPGESRPLPMIPTYTASLQADHTGRVTLALKGLVPSAHGRIYLTPRTGPGGRIEWTCTSEGVRVNFLPGNCRP